MESIDPRWPKILSLSGHEFSTPLTVLLGYFRMLLKEQAGPLTDKQRHLLGEMQKSCARLSALVAEVRELSTLEGGELKFNKRETDLHKALADAIAQLPPMPDREVPVHLEVGGEPALVDADPVRLTQALVSIIFALRRELVGADGLTIRERAMAGGYELLLGDPETIDALKSEPESARRTFDEWRGGVGLSLAVARRILNAHGASIYGPPDYPAADDGKIEPRKAGARIVFRSV